MPCIVTVTLPPPSGKGSIGFIPFPQRLVHSVSCKLSVSIHRGSARYAARRIALQVDRHCIADLGLRFSFNSWMSVSRGVIPVFNTVLKVARTGSDLCGFFHQIRRHEENYSNSSFSIQTTKVALREFNSLFQYYLLDILKHYRTRLHPFASFPNAAEPLSRSRLRLFLLLGPLSFLLIPQSPVNSLSSFFSSSSLLDAFVRALYCFSLINGLC